MRFTFHWPAGDGNRFAATAFDGQIGKPIKVNANGDAVPGTLVDAKVHDDGASAEVTIEVPDGSIGFPL